MTINSFTDRNNPTSATQIKLQTFLIEQEHHRIRLHLPAGSDFAHGSELERLA